MRPRRAKPGPAAKETRATMRREPRGALTLASPAPLRDAMMTCKRLLSIRADAAAPGKARPGGERTQGYNAPQAQGRSSVGRAAVSKTVGRGIESLRPCSPARDPARLLRAMKISRQLFFYPDRWGRVGIARGWKGPSQ